MKQPPVTVDLSGRNAIVTGANAGIGKMTALELARAGANVTMACRSQDKAEAAISEIKGAVPEANLSFLPLDLSRLDAVRQAAATLLARQQPIHILVNNAGLTSARSSSEDGLELTFAVNHLSHFLLTDLLLERIIASGPARIVTVASRSHYGARGIDFDALTRPGRSATGYPEYEVSKLANVLFTRELARRLKERGAAVNTYCLHPGVVASEIWRRIVWPIRPIMMRFMISNEQGALTSLYCATAPECADESGLYYDKCRIKKPSKRALDDALGAELWRRSAQWVG